MRSSWSIATTIVALALLVPIFQNCAPGFSAQSLVSASSNAVSPLIPSTSTSAPVPTATPGATLLISDFYFGRTAGLDHLRLDHTTGTVTSQASVTFAGTPGWIYFDPTSIGAIVSDAGTTGTLTLYARDATSGALAAAKTYAFMPAVVNLSLAPVGTGYGVFGASYDNGALYYGSLSATLSTFQNVQTTTYAAGAHTHSSTYDSKRNLLYVSNLALSTVSIYSISATALTLVGTATVHNARTLVYDATYDKLFIATEAYDGPSYIYSYAIAASGTTYTLTNVGSLAMPMSGAELRVDHAHRFVLATARTAGQESINGMPITSDGQQDSSRTPFSIALTIQTPRVLEVTADGQYVMTATDLGDGTAQTVNIFKMVYDSTMNYVSSTLIYNKPLGTSGFISSGVRP